MILKPTTLPGLKPDATQTSKIGTLRFGASLDVGRWRLEVRAFTLLEVMLALAVSAILLAGIGGVFYGGLRLRDRTAAMLDASLPLQQAFSALRRDLHGAVPPTGTYAMAGDFKIEGQSSGLAQNFRLQCFASSGVINENENVSGGDIQQIIYELRDASARTQNGGRELVRSIYRNPLSTGVQNPEEQVLLSNVEGLEFAGYDGSDWRLTWDTSLGNTNLPSAVRVRVQLTSENNQAQQAPFEMIVPLVSLARTNAQAQ
jgi:type II secretion system protein J